MIESSDLSLASETRCRELSTSIDGTMDESEELLPTNHEDCWK